MSFSAKAGNPKNIKLLAESFYMSTQNLDDHKIDLPPEYCQYQDAGCEFAEACLNCHLPLCVYDEPGGKQRLLKRRRAAEMVRLASTEGKTVRELAQIFEVSTRTVQRALKTGFGNKDYKK
jgi:hypothetical protein